MNGYPTVVMFKEKVYIGGGEAMEQTVMVYDPKQNSYDTLLPYTFKWFSMAVVNNQLVLVGGRDSKSTNKLGVWNEQSNSWTNPLPSMILACHSPIVATHNNRWLVVIGGNDDKWRKLSRVEILDTNESRQWYRVASLPWPIAQALPATIGNVCYILGGKSKGGVQVEVLSVCLDDLISQAVSQPASASGPPTPSPWQSLPNTPLTYSTALAFNGALLAVGGGYGSTVIYHYQPSSRRWIKAGELPAGRYGCTCTVLPSGALYVAGGHGTERVDIASVQ